MMTAISFMTSIHCCLEMLEGEAPSQRLNAGFEPGPRRRELSVRAATKLTQDDRDRS